MILGHSNPIVLDAVQKANSSGQLYAGQHLAEVELAEAVQRVVPCAQLVRFCVSGSEAVQAGLRVARVYTGRHKFLKFEGHYHGWLDSVAFSVNPSSSAIGSESQMEPIPWTSGIPPVLTDEVIVLPWNNLKRLQETLKRHGSEIAAVIAEPVMCNNGCILPEPGFLEGLREACTRHGVVLIFDEIITGFRVAAGGAQARFKVTPDLAILGKAMGSGFPISAIAGSREIMELIASGRAIQAGTMNSQNASVAAALATVTELEQKSRVHLRPSLPAIRDPAKGTSGCGKRARPPGSDSRYRADVPCWIHIGIEGSRLSGYVRLRHAEIPGVLSRYERARNSAYCAWSLVSVECSYLERYRGMHCGRA